MTGRLFLVPNTLDLGCFGDVPPALGDTLPALAIATAARLEHWVVENAKSARAFLKRVDAVAPLARPLQALQITELPRASKGGRQATPAPDLRPLLAAAQAGSDTGLLSEAGLPGVADPGAALVLAAHQAGVAVVPLAGPSSLTLALAASGLNGQSFAFVGYLPQEAAERAQRLRELEQHSRKWRQTQLAIETPYRNAALLAALVEQLHADTWLSVSCGLTLSGGHTRCERIAQWRKRPGDLPSDVPTVFAWLAG